MDGWIGIGWMEEVYQAKYQVLKNREVDWITKYLPYAFYSSEQQA